LASGARFWDFFSRLADPSRQWAELSDDELMEIRRALLRSACFKLQKPGTTSYAPMKSSRQMLVPWQRLRPSLCFPSTPRMPFASGIKTGLASTNLEADSIPRWTAPLPTSVTRDFHILRFVSDASLAVVNPADLL